MFTDKEIECFIQSTSNLNIRVSDIYSIVSCKVNIVFYNSHAEREQVKQVLAFRTVSQNRGKQVMVMPYTNDGKRVKALDVSDGQVYDLGIEEERLMVLDLLNIREVAISDDDVMDDGIFFEVLDVFAEAWKEGNALNGNTDWYYLNSAYAKAMAEEITERQQERL